MPLVNRPDTFPTIREEINRRLRALETSPQLSFSSIDASVGGKLEVHDASGNPLVQLGSLPNGSVGIRIATPGGGDVLVADTNGMGVPFFSTPFRLTAASPATNGAVAVLSTSFVDVYTTEIELLQADAVRVRVPAGCNGTDQGEVRLKLTSSGATTSVRTYGNPSSTQDFHWLHGGSPPLSGPWYLTVQARQTVGTGGIFVWMPDGGATWFRGSEMSPAATATGI